MPKPSFGAKPEFNREEHHEKSHRIARDLSSLQKEIREDFDHRINGLAIILQKFKKLMVADMSSSSSAANEDSIPTLSKKIDDGTIEEAKVINPDEPTGNRPAKTDPLAAYRETARFEAGLYQLNCQLYRFRLELDQEMEFREEPLHQYFRGESELAEVLKQITEKNRQEKSTRS